MLADIYVQEKLNEMSREASRTQGMPVGGIDVSMAIPLARMLGRMLCRVGERLQSAGSWSQHEARSTCPEEPMGIGRGQRGNLLT